VPKITGHLRKMKAVLQSPVAYSLRLDEHEVPLNDLLNHRIHLNYLDIIHCIRCGRKTNKSFQQGHCYPCMQRINECGNCVIFPERCQVEAGQCPQDDWAHAHCHAPQIIYLANSSGLKVGITRDTQVPTRWIDQGAIQAIPIFSAENRYRSGVMEVALKQYVSDRTNWRAMLKNDVESVDMLAQRDDLLETAKQSIGEVLSESNHLIAPIDHAEPIDIDYPVIEYPTKVTSLSLDKQANISGTLLGIKGQYLILDIGVLNVRKFGGYLVEFEFT
jgi:hypothetical protein